MQKVLIAPMTLATQEGPYQKILREAGFELVYPSRPAQLTEDELLRAIQGVKGALAGSEPYTRRIIESNPELRVIVLSVHDEPTVIEQMLRAGVAGFVLKRAAATDLIPAVKEVLHGGTYVCPAPERQLPAVRDQSPTRAKDVPAGE